MKQVETCTSCSKKFECTDDNEIEVENRNFGEGNTYKCSCGHQDKYPLTEQSLIPFTIDEVCEVVNDLRSGTDNRYLIGTVDLKIGDTKKCKKCGNITDVVAYNGLCDYDSNYSTMCQVCDGGKYDKWYESCGDDGCEIHDDDLDIEKMRKEDKEFSDKDKILDLIFERYPPINDGVLELDRMAYMFESMWGKGSTVDAWGDVFTRFMNYCARHDILTK